MQHGGEEGDADAFRALVMLYSVSRTHSVEESHCAMNNA